MVYSLTYRRPTPSTSRDSLNGQEKQESINDSVKSCKSCMSNGIPPALSFDRIIAGGTCPPATVRDFMNYLKYIEYSAENLQFFLWYRDYTTRWQQVPEHDKALSPEWTAALAESDSRVASPSKSRKITPQITEILQHSTLADPFHTPPKSGSLDEKRDVISDYGSSFGDDKTLLSSTVSAHRAMADSAFDDAGVKWKPFTSQPYRDEVSRIISTYIAEGAPRELNLSSQERKSLLHALQHTTHPSAFREIATTVEFSLRQQSHPNFIRWTICNGNRPRVVFARGLGAAGILAGFVADLLITLSSAGRGWRVLPIIGWFIGIATLIAAWKGMCVVLHGLHHRHLRPWEMFSDEADAAVEEKTSSNDDLLSNSANSFEEEPWVPRYNKRNIVRKVFDREIWIQEPALRQIQDTIFLQAVLGSLVVSVIVVGIFCAVPHGHLY